MIESDSDVDILEEIIGTVQRMLPDVPVADRLPSAGDLHDEMPCICMDVLPGDELAKAWGGEGDHVVRDGVPLDVEVLANSRAAAYETAERLRAALRQFPNIEPLGVDSIVVPMFTPRDDVNPRVRSLGAVVDLTLRD